MHELRTGTRCVRAFCVGRHMAAITVRLEGTGSSYMREDGCLSQSRSRSASAGNRCAEVWSEKSCDGGEEVLTLDESPNNAGEIHAIVLSVVRETYGMAHSEQ